LEAQELLFVQELAWVQVEHRVQAKQFWRARAEMGNQFSIDSGREENQGAAKSARRRVKVREPERLRALVGVGGTMLGVTKVS